MPTTFKLTDDEIEAFARMRADLAAGPAQSPDDPTAAILAELATLAPDEHKGRDYHSGFAAGLKLTIDTLHLTKANPDLLGAYLDLMLRTCSRLRASTA